MSHDQQLLNEYFSKTWIPGSGRGITSPECIIKKINSEEWLLDVGCGKNPFKNLHIKSIGIDPAFDEATYKCTIEEFSNPFKFDVATCLGSINFGNIETIELQINKVVSCLKPVSRIYWRLNPGRKDHGNEECVGVPFFPWTFEILQEFALRHNYIQTNETVEEHATRPRLYAEWSRS